MSWVSFVYDGRTAIDVALSECWCHETAKLVQDAAVRRKEECLAAVRSVEAKARAIVGLCFVLVFGIVSAMPLVTPFGERALGYLVGLIVGAALLGGLAARVSPTPSAETMEVMTFRPALAASSAFESQRIYSLTSANAALAASEHLIAHGRRKAVLLMASEVTVAVCTFLAILCVAQLRLPR